MNLRGIWLCDWLLIGYFNLFGKLSYEIKRIGDMTHWEDISEEIEILQKE